MPVPPQSHNTRSCGCTQAVTQALGQDWLGAPEGAAGSSWAVSEAASPGRSNPASSLLPNFMRLKNTQKAPLCGYFQSSTSETRTEAGWLWHPSTQPTCRDSILSMQIMTSESRFLGNHPNTLTQTSLTLIRLCKLLSALPKLSCTSSLASPEISLLPVHSLPLGKWELLDPC